MALPSGPFSRHPSPEGWGASPGTQTVRPPPHTHLQDTFPEGPPLPPPAWALSHAPAFNPVKISWAGKEHSVEKPISCILKFPEND